MALHYKSQRHRHTLHHYIAIPLRCCRRASNHDEDTTIHPRQFNTQRERLQSVRHRSRTFDDLLGSFSLSFWFCKLHNSLGDRLSGLSLPSAQLDELLVLPFQRRDDDSQLLLRGGSGSWVDTLFATDRGSV